MTNTDPEEERLRPHTYDEIQEYDKRLPNWWLWTLYASIVFSFGYWMMNQWLATTEPLFEQLEQEMARVEEAKANSPAASLTDEKILEMSVNSDIIAAGASTFSTTCASCHGADLKGKIGPNLLDAEWLHGGSPAEIATVIRNGVLDKGMPAWGDMLGNARVAEVAAFIVSQTNPSVPE